MASFLQFILLICPKVLAWETDSGLKYSILTSTSIHLKMFTLIQRLDDESSIIDQHQFSSVQFSRVRLFATP